MKLIKDLGMKETGINGYKTRMGIFECPKCNDLFERGVNKIKNTNQKTCFSCKDNGKTHGMRHAKIYSVWLAMRGRCNYKKNKMYHRYGGRGIRVCDRWDGSFENFYADMGDIPEKGMQIDRRDNDGNYEPSNCRWVTRLENIRNSSASKLTVIKVKIIKELLSTKKYTNTFIGNIFGVKQEIISKIKLNHSWKDVRID